MIADPSESINMDRASWAAALDALDQRGYVLPRVLPGSACEKLVGLYSDGRLFRSRIEMARFGFGRGEYKYFDYPLPAVVQTVRETFYGRLVALANAWRARLRERGSPFPDSLHDFLEGCHRAGQKRVTPLILKYSPGDFNCPHQDLYGEVVFPFQVTLLLSRTQADFTGGEFVLAEQRPRRQPRVEVVALDRGDAVVFTTRDRPVAGARGFYRVALRHGVSTVAAGERYTLGVIFHDAR